MAEAEQHGSHSPSHLKLLSFISKFLKPKSLASFDDSVGPKPTRVVSVSAGNSETQNSSVSFPYHHRPKNTEPLKFDAEGSSGRTSNSFVLLQVCALGGFLVLKWAWAKWNQRNETSDKKKTRDDDDDDDHTSLKEDDDDDDDDHHWHKHED